MNINDAGLYIIKKYEGFSSSVYICPAGRPTIGYGSTWDRAGDPVTPEHPDITIEDAERLLKQEVAHVETALRRLVKVDITENMFSALASFVYNVGSGAFQRSTMRMKLNRRNYEGCAREFPKWRMGGGKVLPGLVKRRKEEVSLFLL